MQPWQGAGRSSLNWATCWLARAIVRRVLTTFFLLGTQVVMIGAMMPLAVQTQPYMGCFYRQC